MERTDAGVRIVLAETHRPRAALSAGMAVDRWPRQPDPGHHGGGELVTVKFDLDAGPDGEPAGSAHPDETATEHYDHDSANVIELDMDDILADPPEWQERALCAQTDPEAFFPEKGGSTREAKRICSGCEVRSECLEYALDKDERFGIWGGMSERERRRLRRRAV